MTPQSPSLTIAVFGSSAVLVDSADYLDAYAVGGALAQAGYIVATGGYQGVMEAASKGAGDAGGHVIGVTSAPLEKIRQAGANQWVTQIMPFDSLRDRLLHLVMKSDAYVVMPGGIGTLNELILAWELMLVNEIPARPLICYGSFWETILAPLRDTIYMRPVYWEMLRFAHTPDEVIAYLREG